jgi:hypothetical protein
LSKAELIARVKRLDSSGYYRAFIVPISGLDPNASTARSPSFFAQLSAKKSSFLEWRPARFSASRTVSLLESHMILYFRLNESRRCSVL